MVTILSRLMFAIASFFVFFYMLFGQDLIAIFGHEYADAYDSLIILSIAQMLNAAAGAVGVILMMTGFGQRVVIWVGIATLLNILLNAYLIPIYGIEGAAIGTGISLVFWNIFLIFEVIKKIGIEPTAIGVNIIAAN